MVLFETMSSEKRSRSTANQIDESLNVLCAEADKDYSIKKRSYKRSTKKKYNVTQGESKHVVERRNITSTASSQSTL